MHDVTNRSGPGCRPPARMFRSLGPLAVLAVFCFAAPLLVAAPAPPPGFNVHRVGDEAGHVFWRGGAPRRDTLVALAAAAKARGTTVTLVDLRHPSNADDRSGKDGRLSPSAEAALAKRLGMRYLSISALDRRLPERLEDALASGDVYMHCMYGVNRTGFATARYARVAGRKVGRTGLGARDWNQGAAFQARLEKAGRR